MAQSVIGALRVNLGIDATRFERGLGRAGRQLRSMRAQFTAFAAAGAAVGGALTTLGVQAMGTARRLGQLSQIANSTPEEFQRIAAAARTVGIEEEKLADILKDVQDRVGDFLETGGGPMADFFENIAPRVGLTAEMFRNLSGPQALGLFVDGLNRAGLSQDQMTFYLEAMASDMTALIPLLADGGAELQRLGDRAADLGGIMSDEAQRSLARMHESLDDLRTVSSGLARDLGAAVAPSVASLARAFTDLLKPGSLLREALAAIFGQAQRLGLYFATFTAALGVRYVGALVAARAATLSLAGAFAFLRTAIMSTGIGIVVIAVAEAINLLVSARRATASWGEALVLLRSVAAEVWNGVVVAAEAIPLGLRAVWADVQMSFYSMLASMTGAWADFVGELASGLNLEIRTPIGNFRPIDFGSGFEEYAAEMRAAADNFTTESDMAFGRRRTAMDLAAQSIKNGAGIASEALTQLRNAANLTDDSASSAADSIERINNRLSDLGGSSGGGRSASEALNKVAIDFEDVNQRISAGADAVTSLFSAITGGSGGVRQALARILQQIAEAQFRMALIGSASGKSGGGFLGFLGGLFGGFRAAGGPVAGGKAYVVGERGPELLLPNGSGSIVPNHALGGVASITVNVQGANGDRHIEQLVMQGVSQGLSQYDTSLPDRISQINDNPRYR